MRTETGIPSDGTNRLIVRGAALALLAGALIYLTLKVFDSGDTVDFKYIHLAGELWLEGLDPYSIAYKEQGEIRYVGRNRPEYLLYPPHWWGIASTSALISYESAGLLWRIFMALCLIGGCLALHGTVRQIAGTAQWGRASWRIWAMLVMAAAMSATAIALALGQTSCLLFLGVCLYARAFIARDRWLMGVALILVMLKPNFGLALSLFLVPTLFWWRSLIGAAVAVLLLSLPAILPHGLLEVIGGYLHALGQWETLPPNTARNTTGLRYLAYMGLGATVSGKWFAILGLAVALGLGVALRHRLDQPGTRAAALCVLIAALVLIVPLHTYDMMLLIPLIALGAIWPLWAQAGLGVLMLVSLRPNNLEAVLGLVTPGETYFTGTGTATVAAVLILLVCLVGLMIPRATPA